MSHEIRTPLNGVVGCAELLRQTDLDSEQREYLEILQASVDSLVDVVDDVFDASEQMTGNDEP